MGEGGGKLGAAEWALVNGQGSGGLHLSPESAPPSPVHPSHYPLPHPRHQILDRLTKGVREAPSKALVGELAHSCGDSAAAAYSVRQALSTLGMLLGSVAAGAAFQLTGRSYTATFALSAVPALAGFGLVLAALGRGAAAADAARRQRGGQGAGLESSTGALASRTWLPVAPCALRWRSCRCLATALSAHGVRVSLSMAVAACSPIPGCRDCAGKRGAGGGAAHACAEGPGPGHRAAGGLLAGACHHLLALPGALRCGIHHGACQHGGWSVWARARALVREHTSAAGLQCGAYQGLACGTHTGFGCLLSHAALPAWPACLAGDEPRPGAHAHPLLNGPRGAAGERRAGKHGSCRFRLHRACPGGALVSGSLAGCTWTTGWGREQP